MSMSRSFTVFFSGTRVNVDLLIVAFCLVDYILYLALSAWDGFAEAKVLRLVKLFRIIRSLRAVRILRTIRSPPPASAFYLFFYLFVHKTLHTYCHVQREQDNKAKPALTVAL